MRFVGWNELLRLTVSIEVNVGSLGVGCRDGRKAASPTQNKLNATADWMPFVYCAKRERGTRKT